MKDPDFNICSICAISEYEVCSECTKNDKFTPIRKGADIEEVNDHFINLYDHTDYYIDLIR
jgi:hypothetical protein